MDTNSNGKVSHLEFKDYLYKNEQKTSLSEKAINDEISEEIDLFIKYIDTNNDGIMELKEMKPLLSAQIQAEELPEEYTETQLKDYFQYVISTSTWE